MNSPLKRRTLDFAVLLVALSAAACGVKGDPLPPERPVDLGRGRPTFKRATEGLKVERARPSPADQDEDEKSEGADDEQD